MRTILAAAVSTLAITITPLGAAAQEGKANAPRARYGVPLSAEASTQLGERVLAHPDLPQRQQGHRLVAIRVTAAGGADANDTAGTIVTVVLFDHTALEARRVVLDPVTNQLLLNETLPGRPQRSDRELAEAVSIVRTNPALARLLDRGGVLDGGFIVDDPGGSRHRMMQLKLMSADRRALLRSIDVDLTSGEVAAITSASGVPNREPRGKR